MASFVKVMRSEQAAFLDLHPNANHLLNVIARRARRTKCHLNQLEIGECFISFRSVGMTEQQYRTAKKQLHKWALVEFKKGRRVTDKGTVALLLNSSVYDINVTDGNGSLTEEQRKGNGKLTTNKECNKEKNDQEGKKKDLLSGKPDSTLVLNYLNDSLGTKYKATTKAHIENINARIGEGHSVDDLKAVINSKKIEWGSDASMAQYLRPQTLFGNKFQGYLVAAKTPAKLVPAKSVHSFENQNYTSGKF